MTAEAHGWAVDTVVEATLLPSLSGLGVRHYRASCVCGWRWPLQSLEPAAVAAAVDHVRKATGRPTSTPVALDLDPPEQGSLL